MSQVCLDTHYWTVMNQFFVLGSVAAYFSFSLTLYSNKMFLIFTSNFPFIGEPAGPRLHLSGRRGQNGPTGSCGVCWGLS